MDFAIRQLADTADKRRFVPHDASVRAGSQNPFSTNKIRLKLHLFPFTHLLNFNYANLVINYEHTSVENYALHMVKNRE